MHLMIIADDYGLHPAYDRGLILAAAEGLVDGVGAMVLHRVDPAPLAETGVEIGLHLELLVGADAVESLDHQIALFEQLFGRAPAYFDGHHHCHCSAAATGAVIERALAFDVPVRSVGTNHRRQLRAAGVAVADQTVGRESEDTPAVPSGVRNPQSGVTEWFTHPGFAGGPSSYDAGRKEDLRTLQAFTSTELTRVSPSALVQLVRERG